MWFLYTVAVLFVLVAWYTSPLGRDVMKVQPWMQWYYKSPFAEKVETVLFKKSETLMLARFKMLMAGMWQVVLGFGAVDPTPFLIFVPEKYHTLLLALPTVIMGIDGVIGEIQRRWTTKPLEILTVPETTPVSPQVAEAVKEFEKRKVASVDIVKEATKEGTTDHAPPGKATTDQGETE